MARIRPFSPSTQEVRRHTTVVDCEYHVLHGDEVLLHLSTFGSNDRISPRKSSQSLQLDLPAARELVDIIENAFPGLRR